MDITIWVNERSLTVSRTETAFTIRDHIRPDADLVIYNGYPLSADHELEPGDRIVMIRRGEIPAEAEFEALLVSRHTPFVHEKIRHSTVGIAGVGGLGSAVAIALARIGIGGMVLVDFDVVEPSNLNRQQYFIDQIGVPKVHAMKATLSRVNPYVRIECFHETVTEGNLRKFFALCDIVVEAFDRADQKAMLINAFGKELKDKVLIASSGMAGHDSSNSIQTVAFTRNIFIVGDQVQAARVGVGLMAPRVGIAAHHQANAVLRILTGQDPAA